MKRLFLIFVLLITFNANSIAGSVMMSSMGNMDTNVGMSHDCHGEMNADHEMVDHCESDSAKHEDCDKSNCGACVYHCSSAVLADISSTTALDPPLPEFQYLITGARSVYCRMLRPPQTA